MRKIIFIFVITLCVSYIKAQDIILCDASYVEAEKALQKGNLKDAKIYLQDIEKECGIEYAKELRLKIENAEKSATNSTKSAFKLTPSKKLCDGIGDNMYIVAKGVDGITASSKANWIEIDAVEGDVIQVVVAPNDKPEGREGEIVVKDRKNRTAVCKLKQDEGSARIDVSQDFIAFSKNADKKTINVEANTTWSVNKNENNWLKLKKNGKDKLTIECAKNKTTSTRYAMVNISTDKGQASKQITIVQNVGDTYLELAEDKLTFNNYSSDVFIIVESNTDWNYVNPESWITLGKWQGRLNIKCSSNEFARTREGSVILYTTDGKIQKTIQVSQKGAVPYLSVSPSTISNSGKAERFNVSVNTNIPDWTVSGDNSWSSITRTSSDNAVIALSRNDVSFSRNNTLTIIGGNIQANIDIYQPNRGYAGRYNDYFDANGDWHLTWVSAELGLFTAVGMNVSAFNVRWKPVELSLINLNLGFNFLNGDLYMGWEPVVRGFLPITRDGHWAAYAGLGAHVDFVSPGDAYFLFELGAETQWNEKFSSRMFFKYNGCITLGMSFDFGYWRD